MRYFAPCHASRTTALSAQMPATRWSAMSLSPLTMPSAVERAPLALKFWADAATAVKRSRDSTVPAFLIVLVLSIIT